MIRSGPSLPSVAQALLMLWRLAPKKMRRLVLRGLIFRMLQTLCLAGVFGVISLWSGAFVAGTDVTSEKIVTTAMVVGVLFLLQFFCAYRSVSDIWLTSFRLVGAIRHRLLRRLLELPMTFHMSRPKGDIAAALTGDLTLVENLLTDGLPRLVHSLTLPLFVAFVMAMVDTATALFAVLPVIVGLPLLFLSCRRLARLSNLKQEAQANAISRVLQWAEGMETVLSFGMLKRCRIEFTEPLLDIHRLSVRMVASLTAPLLGFGAIVMSGLALLVAMTGYRFGVGTLSTTQMTMILMLALPLYAPLLGLAQFIELAAVAHGAIGRLNAIMVAGTNRPVFGPKPSGYAINCEDVGFSYTSSQSALKSVIFELPERGLTAIIGPSGAGKSTLLQLLAGLLQPSEGRILIGGVDIRDIPLADLHKLVSVVFQDVVLFKGSVRDNIALGNHNASQAEIEAAAKAASAHDFITALPDGYDTQIGETGLVLSGGERQRLSVARAILKDTPIILVDEGTASVDNLTARVIAAALQDQARHRSVIVVTHLLSLVEGVDQVVYVEKSYV